MNILEFAVAQKLGGGGGVPINNQDKTITQNGTYIADEGFTGLGTVKVSVARDDQTDIEAQLNAVIDGSIVETSGNAASIRAYAFYKCSTLTTADFPVATSLGSSAFYGCSKLTTVNAPVATNIGTYAFCNCSTLTKVNFTVATRIGGNAFDSCKALTALILRSEVICTLSGISAFYSTPIYSGTGYIYVPRALVDSYKAASNWSTYAAQFRALEDYTVDGTITGALDESKI